jgi:integrase
MQHLIRSQLVALLKVARKYSERDYLAILVGFTHGLRVSEILGLTTKQIVDGYIVVQRLKAA